jgi:ribosomal protein S18 acetylase RimI-like enzyme
MIFSHRTVSPVPDTPGPKTTRSPGPAPHPAPEPRRAAPGFPAVTVRDARPDELAELGDLRVTAYEAGGFLADASHYGETLRTLGHDGIGQILVAVGDGDSGAGRTGDGGTGQLLGTVMLQLWPHAEHVVQAPDEAEIRALAVTPEARGRGVGATLLRAVADRARACGVRRLVLSTQTTMLAAQHLYTEAGFRRLPERDWQPVPGFTLLAYGVELSD